MKNLIGKKGIMAIAAGALALTVGFSGTYAWFTFNGNNISDGSSFTTSTIELQKNSGPEATALKFAKGSATSATVKAQGDFINAFTTGTSSEKLQKAIAVATGHIDDLVVDGILGGSAAASDPETQVVLEKYADSNAVTSSSILFSNVTLKNTSNIDTYMKLKPALTVTKAGADVTIDIPVLVYYSYENMGKTQSGIMEVGNDGKTLYSSKSIPAGGQITLYFATYIDPSDANLSKELAGGSSIKLGALDNVELIQAENNAVMFADGWKDSGISFK